MFQKVKCEHEEQLNCCQSRTVRPIVMPFGEMGPEGGAHIFHLCKTTDLPNVTVFPHGRFREVSLYIWVDWVLLNKSAKFGED